VQDQGSKSACVVLAMITLAKVRMPFLVSNMSTHQREELNMVEGSACNYSCHMWKPTSHAIATKVL